MKSRKIKTKGALTFKEATDAAIDKSAFIRNPGMGPGWTISTHLKFPDELWCNNPHTGSEYAYTASDADKAREDWYVVKDKIDQASLAKG